MANILGVGIATLDIINSVEIYPPEDSEVRASAQSIRRGGNATNTLVVLSQLGHQCAWAGTLANDVNSELIRSDLTDYKIELSAVKEIPEGQAPTSYVTLSKQNGSRTIVHFRDLAELCAVDFRRIDLSRFHWLHFEGRNVQETQAMLEYAREQMPHIPRSLEVEKPRQGIECLFPLANLLLYSRNYAESRGFDTATGGARAFLQSMVHELPTADHVCTWGEAGAYAVGKMSGPGRQIQLVHSPAYVPTSVVDTLGAGDTFNAGMIDAQLRGQNLEMSLQAACHLAGRKCGQPGLRSLV